MDTDLVLTFGIVLVTLSLPSFLGGWVEGRLSPLGVALVALATGMIGSAVLMRPEGYVFHEIPAVMLGVVARVIN